MKRRHLSTALFLFYLAILGALLYFHEPWRDELQCWTIAKESSSVLDLLHEARYEGHPSAWYVVLFLITRVTDSFLAVRLVHLSLIAAAVFLLLFKSPFSTAEKCLLVFGYFFVYEYAALSRIYALGILVLFLVCVLLEKPNRRWWPICALLFLAMQVNVFSALLAAALCVPLLLSGSGAWTRLPTARFERSGKSIAAGLALVASGLALSGYDMLPPADSTFVPDWKWSAPQLREALGSFLHAMMPIPRPELHFWNSNALEYLTTGAKPSVVEPVMAVALLLGCLFSLRRSPSALAFFAAAWIAITTFLSVKYLGFVRHHGHYFLAYVMALWIARQGQRPKGRPVFLSVLLSLHVAAAGLAVFLDAKYPFSQSREAADFIEESYPPDRLLVGHFDYATSPVGFHLGRPLFFPNQNRHGTFIYWSGVRFSENITEITLTANPICRENGGFVLVTSYPVFGDQSDGSLRLAPDAGTVFRLANSFSPAVVEEEAYWVYEVGCEAK